MALLLIGAQVPRERIINRIAKPTETGVDLFRLMEDQKAFFHLNPRRPVLVHSVVDSTWYRVKVEGQIFFAHRGELNLVASK